METPKEVIKNPQKKKKPRELTAQTTIPSTEELQTKSVETKAKIDYRIYIGVGALFLVGLIYYSQSPPTIKLQADSQPTPPSPQPLPPSPQIPAKPKRKF